MQFSVEFAPRKKRISLTALIDVVFILLLFFMLTSSFSQFRTSDMALPAKADASIVEVKTYPELLNLNSQGELVTQQGQTLEVAELEQYLKNIEDFNGQVVLIPAPDCTLQTMLASIETIKAAGIANVNLGPVAEAE